MKDHHIVVEGSSDDAEVSSERCEATTGTSWSGLRDVVDGQRNVVNNQGYRRRRQNIDVG